MIVAGMGFTKRATRESFQDALTRTGGTPDALATAEDKADQLAPFARELGLPLHAVPPEELARQVTHSTSAASLRARGTGSVAEAAALAAAGPGATLLAPRSISTDRMATCALAQGKTP
ncbi:precorrin methylase [Roseovarius atlanticus]|uniref:Precorrin methylase n=1 Tax=Roseovarius atlanticus TaxID=1641875 RepID=A0A0T5NT76_9RHOB|nr:cobalamin biosynthesis protein [Roseovarius atlanticus]KRS11926.1 precorrin methylase [Roseovarius atlanticus]